MSKIIVVDEDDNEIGVKERSEIGPDDIYRVAAIWIANSQGDILMAQRSFNKAPDHDPGKWDPGACGTVEEGETYESNIIKEAEEELGIKDIKPEKGPKVFMSDDTRQFFGQTFTTVVDKDIEELNFDKIEVEAVKWFTEDELRRQINNNPAIFTKGIRQAVEPFLKL